MGGGGGGHAWKALSFDGGRGWHLCDPCWAAGAVGGSFTRSFTKCWWCTPPQCFVERHLPENPSDQLLDRPVSKAEWRKLPDTAWTPTTFGSTNDGDEVLSPSTGTLRRGQAAEFRIFLAESSPSTLRLCENGAWGNESAETLRASRVQGGYVHSITFSPRSTGEVTLYK